MAVFRPPVALVGPRVLSRTRGPERAFFRHASPLPVGQSVLKIDGAYQTIMTPTTDQCASASEVYQGGHDYTVDSATAAALTAAGYGSYLS